MPLTPKLSHAIFAAIALSVSVSVPVLPLYAQATPAATTPAATARKIVRSIANGVELIQEIIPDGTPEGPLVITVVQIDPKVKGVRITAALGQDRVWGSDPTQGREIVSTLVARHKAVAGVNAGFFPFAGPPIGLHVQEGEMVTEPTLHRTCFLVMKDGTTRFESFNFSGSVRAGEGANAPTVTLDGLNRKPGKGNELLLFSPIFFDATLRTPERFEVVLKEVQGTPAAGKELTGTVSQIGVGGATRLSKGTIVLSGSGTAAEWLRQNAMVGAKLSVRMDVTTTSGKPFDIANIREAVSGAPRILRDGKVDIPLKEEGMGASFSTTRHPRTSVGVTREGKLLLVTVDGRQKGLSRGVSLTELANLMLKYGVVEGVNLDGGGSSTAVVRNVVVNSPSDGRERPVANMLLVLANGPAGSTKKSPLPSAPPALAVGETRRLPANSSDTFEGIWGIPGGKPGIGFVTQDGVFYALRPGAGEALRVSGNAGKPERVPINVLGETKKEAEFEARLTLQPDANDPRHATLQIRLANADNDPLRAEIIKIEVTGGKAESETVSTDASGNARMSITWDDPASPTQSITVSSATKRFPAARINRTATGQ